MNGSRAPTQPPEDPLALETADAGEVPEPGGEDTPETGQSGGSGCSSGPPVLRASDFHERAVNLHIYDVRGNIAMEYMNTMFRMLGTGAFHLAVEVCGDEWSYGYTKPPPTGVTGVFNCAPGQNKCFGLHRETITLGKTAKTAFEIDNLLDELCDKWHGEEYDLLRHNCCHFSDEFCKQLGVGGVPSWVLNLAHVGSTLTDGVWMVLDAPHHILFETAKAGDHAPRDPSAEAFESHTARHYVRTLDEDMQIKHHKSSGRHLTKKGRKDKGCKVPEADPDKAPQRRRCCFFLTSSKGRG